MVKTYQNGMNTRQQILSSAKELFYEQGFHETSFEDICKTAHVSRRTAYYHFKDKELLRYEVHWEWVIQLRRLAEKYCKEQQYLMALAMYLVWKLMLRDAKYRKFCLDYYQDYPVYDPDTGMGQFFRILCQQMYEHIWPLEQISPVAFSSVYGFIEGMFQIMAAHPDTIKAEEMLHDCIFWGTGIWGIPRETIAEYWDAIESYISQFPEQITDKFHFY